MTTEVHPGTKCQICKTEAMVLAGALQLVEDLTLCPTCVGKCGHCGKPVPVTHQLCRLCQSNTLAHIRENEVPLVHTESDASERARRALRSPVTGKPYPQGISFRDEDDEADWNQSIGNIEC